MWYDRFDIDVLFSWYRGSAVVYWNLYFTKRKACSGYFGEVQNEGLQLCSTPMEVGWKLTRNGSEEKMDVTLYNKIIESLMYLAIIRPDILHAVSLICWYIENPIEDHPFAVKSIFQYLKGIIDFGILNRKIRISIF